MMSAAQEEERWMSRIIDLIAVFAVAIVVLLPKPSVKAHPALAGEPLELDRLAELEDARYQRPDDVEPALALAEEHLSFLRSDWALMTLAGFASRPDFRVHMTLATAHAERLEADQVVAEAALVEKDCAEADAGRAAPKCPPGTLAKVGLIRQSMQVLLDGKIDPAKDPVAARDAVSKVLHSAKFKGAPSVSVKPPAPAAPKK
jgi:hypothetical protein